MATKKQKKELIEILKFTPMNVRILIHGYGGECYIGSIKRETYELFKEKKVDIEQYANDWDNEFYPDIPSEHRFFEPGNAYECDNLIHASGATMDSSSRITVDDENGNTLWECSLNISDLEDQGVNVSICDDYDCEEAENGSVIFWGGQGEKGCFFDGGIILRSAFDPKKLNLSYSNADGWLLSSLVEYDGEEVDGSGGYSTTGKWSEHKFWIAGDEEVYEGEEREEGQFSEEIEDTQEWDPVAELEKIKVPRDIGDEEKSQWFNKIINPIRKGEYEVMIQGENWPFPVRAQWSGRTWKQDGKKIEIIQWRGLNYNPAK